MEVDLSLDDQANLGQKIKLAEIICKVLERMKCPSPLMAHQIQGLDFPSVLPVMNWLLQKVGEVRAENEAATCVPPPTAPGTRDAASLPMHRWRKQGVALARRGASYAQPLLTPRLLCLSLCVQAQVLRSHL